MKKRRWTKCWAFLFILFLAFGKQDAKADELKVGDSLYFGFYEQDNKDKGTEPIEWTVLEIRNGNALLISKKAIEYMQFDSGDSNTGWESSTLRTWLNEIFFETSYTEEEKEAIISKKLPNDSPQGNPAWKTFYVTNTRDKVFLLSYNDIQKYFESEKSRKAYDTVYAESKGDLIQKAINVAIKEADWWTRSSGASKKEICYIDASGKFASKKSTDKGAVRPALWLDMEADSEMFSYARYNEAVDLEKEEKYGEAADIFESLGTFENSKKEGIECRYLQAGAAYDDKDYELAIELYTSLDGYKESDKKGRAARYDYACFMQENEEYSKAAELFGEAGQYKDSMQKMRECCDMTGIPVYFFSAESVNTGLDTGYSKANAIKGDDRHFGWRMGRFFMTNFTRVSEGNGENPVFIKTLGDSITLWFDLEQDIYNLNGKKDLEVSEDKNGYDQYFGIKKTNFGYGTLIIRHTDYQNAKSDPVIYTDYLLAKGTSGADTKVVLNEEGDYEATLDYQLQDNDIRHINQKYGNYKIRFNFSVRNGNCMVYPFDVETKNELQNTSVTENGFYLDLARSRYLQIDVKRSVVLKGANGEIIEDERFNRPAKDGDRYTDEGIYTISVKNIYTGESTVKTIFVGSDELLQEYINNGFSVDRLK